jgi:hypothetical protein
MKGEVVYLHAFDVGNEIVMARVRTLLGQTPFAYEVQADRTFPKDVPLYKPLAVEPSFAPLLRGQPVRLLVRVYDVGVVTVALRVAFEVENLLDLQPFHNPQLDDGTPLHQHARELCPAVVRDLGDALLKPVAPSEPEAYTAFCFTELGVIQDVNRWLAAERRPVAGLLTETDPNRLSDSQVAEVLRLQRSFENADLVVIDWDAALVVDLTGYVDDTLFVLELANVQLEEFRAMDRTLDRYLERAYADMGRRRFALFGMASNVLRELRWFRVDVTKLADEVSHITKLLGDWHLARVYVAAQERFYLDQWRRSVERRLGQLDQLYSVLQSEVSDQRMLWLEIIIVVLFVLDLVLIFWK